MMKLKNNIAIGCMLLMANTLMSQSAEYQYKRPILEVKDQWHSISLPQDVLNKTNASKSDIRIMGYGKSGKEIKVPYLLKSLKDDVIVEDENVGVFNESTIESIFVYVTEDATLGKINELNLDIGNTNYDGRIKLEGKDGEQWYTILEDYRIFSFNKASNNYKYTTLEVPESDYKSYRISISNIKNPILNSVVVAKKAIKLGKYFDVGTSIRHEENDEENNLSLYTIKLDSISRISKLTFDIEGDFDHYRRVKLSAIVDSIKTKKGWKKLKKTFYDGALISYEDDKLLFDEQLVSTIEMTIYNLDDQPLQINSVKATTAQNKLVVRFANDSDYYLLYGNPNAHAPKFDLTNFKENIPENVVSLKLGQVSQVKPVDEISSFFISTSALYAIMAAIIVVLGWFTIKMLSSDSIAEE